jgi:hypothetical protein
MARSAACGSRFNGMVASFSIIAVTRCGADRISSGTAPVSGMLRQYFFGISARIAFGLARAGLNMLS